MALIRLSPTTALPTAKQMIGDLGRCVNEAGSLSCAQIAKEKLDSLQTLCSDKVLDVDVGISDKADNKTLQQFLSWVGLSNDSLDSGNSEPRIVELARGNGSLALRLYVWVLESPPVRVAGTPRPPVLVAVIPSVQFDEALKGGIETASEDRPVVLLLAPSSEETRLQFLMDLQAMVWQLQVYQADSLPTASLEELLHSPPWDGLLEVLRACAVVSGLESVAKVFTLSLEQEIRGFKAKRSVAQQRASKLQQRPAVQSGGELIGDFRNRVQRQFGEFERGAADRFQALLGPQDGSLIHRLESLLLELTNLDSEKRAKSTVTTVPAEFEDLYLGTLGDGLQAHISADLTAMQDLFRLMQDELEKVLSEAGGPPLSVQLRLLDENRVQRMLQSSVGLQRNYQGELVRQGFFEYAMMARRYLMILFMFISAFGLSFLRGYREFMIPVSVLLLSIGSIVVIRSVQRERSETLEKEINKAKESLRAETKRMCSDVQRAWGAMISQHLSDQSQAILGQIEFAIRTHQTQRANESVEEKQRLQRQLQGLENSERKLLMTAKSKEAVVSALSQISGELRQLVLTNVKQTSRAVS